MKKAITGLAITTAMFGLASCTVEVKESSNTPKTTSAPRETSAPVQSTDDIYITFLESEYPGVTYMFGGRAELITLGKTMCQAIDEGMTIESLALMVMEYGHDPLMIGTILGAAVYSYCPENEWYVNQAGV